MKRFPLRCALLPVAWSFALGAAPAVRLHVDGAAPRVAVSPSLSGIFFEEINHAGEGRLYADMILDRGGA
jgi:hypothetical protein